MRGMKWAGKQAFNLISDNKNILDLPTYNILKQALAFLALHGVLIEVSKDLKKTQRNENFKGGTSIVLDY